MMNKGITAEFPFADIYADIEGEVVGQGMLYFGCIILEFENNVITGSGTGF